MGVAVVVVVAAAAAVSCHVEFWTNSSTLGNVSLLKLFSYK